MKKEELKFGNVVETRIGAKYLLTLTGNKSYEQFIRLDLLHETIVIFMSYDDVLENLKHRNDNTKDIMKVYEDYTCSKLIWERKEKPVLTNDEKAILRNIPKSYKYIARDKNNYLYVYTYKPKKDEENNFWSVAPMGNSDELSIFSHLFNFIKWKDEEPYLIEDLIG